MTFEGPRRRRSLHRLVALIGALSLCLAVVPTAIAASPNSKKDPAPAEATVSMHVDCSTIPATRQARAAARRYGVCAEGGGPAPMSTITSNCGSLSLFVNNDGAGFLQWRGQIRSSLGPFVTGSYAGTWSNLTTKRQGPIGRNYAGITSDWLDSISINTGAGSVFGIIGGAAIHLWWGPWCISTIPVDSHATVT